MTGGEGHRAVLTQRTCKHSARGRYLVRAKAPPDSATSSITNLMVLHIQYTGVRAGCQSRGGWGVTRGEQGPEPVVLCREPTRAVDPSSRDKKRRASGVHITTAVPRVTQSRAGGCGQARGAAIGACWARQPQAQSAVESRRAWCLVQLEACVGSIAGEGVPPNAGGHRRGRALHKQTQQQKRQAGSTLAPRWPALAPCHLHACIFTGRGRTSGQ